MLKTSTKFTISGIAVIMLVALRLTIGWHFLYEGAWKIANYEEFSTRPFLVMAKGPAAPFYYAMVYDLNGRERLKIEKDSQGDPVIRGEAYTEAWKRLVDRAARKYGFDEGQKDRAAELCDRYVTAAKDYLNENSEGIQQYFDSLDRFEEERIETAPFQKKRRWDRQNELRGEAAGWLTELEAMEKSYHRAFREEILNEEQKAQGNLPIPFSLEEIMNLVMTASLTAIGLCLMLGFCTRLACLGGAAFLLNVVLTQWPWPLTYPPAPAVVGHALLVDKNFVEMMAMLALAATPVGRWAGLDFFLYQWFGRPLMQWLSEPVEARERLRGPHTPPQVRVPDQRA